MKFKKALSLFMTAILLSSSMPLNAFAEDISADENAIVAEDTTASGSALTVMSSDIDVEFNVTGQWSDGFTGEITVKNISDTLIEDWQIEMTFPHEIETLWNAKIESYEDGVYNIKNAGDNNNINIPVGGSITFGFKAKHDGEITEPSEIYLATTKRKAEKELYTTDFQFLNDWGSGFTAQITITNNTSDDIEGWHLLFDFDKEMTSIWNAVIESYEDGRYTISNAEYNSVIPANGSVTFGFIGTPGNVESEPSKFDLVESNNNDKLFISFDESDFINADSKFYVFDKLDKLGGNVYSLYGLKELKYTINYGEMELSSDTISADKKGNWAISPATLMWENGHEEIGNVITVEAEDLRGNKTKNSIKIFSYYFDEDLFNSLDHGDNDGDGLFNYEETIYGTNIEIVDTDDDELSDYYEINFSLTNPLEKDTDGNGTEDGDEDFDNDTLSNKEEMIYTSDPHTNDTDGDGLKDNEEIKHNTDVWMQDTDTDGLFDPLELELGTDPLNPDSNGNDILDGDESYSRTITPEADELDERVVPTLEISAAPNLINTVEVSRVTDTVFLVEEMPGFLGSGYEFEMAGTFDEAKLTFKFDSNFLDIPDFKPTIYYFNEDEQVLEPLDNQVIDLDNCTVSADLEHFSEYILINRTEFEKAWKENIIAPVSENALGGSVNVVLCIDSSGSMEWNDPQNLRISVATEFINSLKDDDMVGVVDFDHSSVVLSPLTNNKSTAINSLNKLDSYGLTDITAGIKTSINCLNKSTSELKFIILLTDGDGDYDESLTTQALEQGIKIYTVGLGEAVSKEKLNNISSITGARYYHANNANDLISEFKLLTDEIIDLTTDSDKDGISDYHEVRLRLCNGTYINTDIDNPDTDDDDILDGEEIVPVFVTEDTRNYINGNSYFKLISNPTKKDSDDDGLLDSTEAYFYDTLNTDKGLIEPSYSSNFYHSKLSSSYNPHITTIGYIYTNALKKDTDNDGLDDSDELGSIITVDDTNYYNVLSNPMVKDSDYDGINDYPETINKNNANAKSIYNNPLEYNYDKSGKKGFGLIISPAVEVKGTDTFVSIGQNDNFKICTLGPKKKVIYQKNNRQYYILVAMSGVEVRGGSRNQINNDIRGCHYDEIYVKADAEISLAGELLLKPCVYAETIDSLLNFGIDSNWETTDYSPTDLLYYDSSKNLIYLNEPSDGLAHDANGYSLAWQELHFEERFWMNCEYDRFLPININIINSGHSSLLTKENKYADIFAKYHNPDFNSKYCSDDGLEGLYSKNGPKLSLFTGDKFFDNIARTGEIDFNSMQPQYGHVNACVDNIHDACPTHGPTFNYCKNNLRGHYYFDMVPYFWWGNYK